MYKLLNSPDFEMPLKDWALNLKFLQNDLKKKDCLKYTILKMKQDFRLKSNFYPFLKMESIVQLKLNKFLFLKNQLVQNYIKPP